MKNAFARGLVPAFSLLMLAACGGGGGDDGDNDPPPQPAAISAVQIVSGNNQTGVAGAELPAPIVGRIVDSSGNALGARVLTFHVKSGGGTLFVGSATSDSNGLISDRWTLGPGTGAQQVEIRGGGGGAGGTVYATFDSTSIAGSPSQISSVTGDGQAQQQASTLPVPLTVTVADRLGNVVAGVTVTFAPCTECGSANPTTAVTNGAGVASTVWTLGVPIGPQRLIAKVAGNDLWTFNAGATQAPPGAPVSVFAYLGAGQTIDQHRKNPQPFVVVVHDALGNVVPGAEVDFAPEPGGDYFTPATVTSGSDGGASFSSYFHFAGTQRVRASVPGVAVPAVFDIVVQPNGNEFDGLYDCTISNGWYFFLEIVDGVLDGHVNGNLSTVFTSVAPEPLTADGQFEATWRMSLDNRARMRGGFDVDADGVGTASGDWLNYDGRFPPAPTDPSDLSWNCVRQ